MAETKERARAGLYERLVREGWDELHESVRGFHRAAERARAPRARSRCGAGRGRQRVCSHVCSGCPRSGEAVTLRLSVEPLEGGGERWRRTFDGKDFITEQREHAGALLAERAGPFETLFRLTIEGGALAYRSESTALRAGRLRLRFPQRLAPRVEASECAGCDGGGVLVSVRVTAPLVGLLIEYEGLVRTKEENTV